MEKKALSTKASLISVLAIAILVLSACGDNAATNNANDNSAKASNTSNDNKGEATVSNTEDAKGIYNPPITVTSVMGLSDQVQKAVTIKPDVVDDNIWTRSYEKELGIKVKYLWTVPGVQMEQKMNVAISANDLPDIIPANPRQFKMLVDSGVAMDLTKLFDENASEFTKQMMDADKQIGIDQATVDGKLMGLPAVNGAIDGASMIWIRADWLKNLGLEPPKSIDDVMAIAEAFTKNDPDQNGADDTYGLGLVKDLFGGFAGLDGFFEGNHAYANGWIDDGSGNLVFGGIQPEVKSALAKVAEMYKNGYIDKEFSVKDSAKVAESVTAGKVGMQFGQHWNPFYPLQDSKNKDPKADWQAFPIVSVDGESAKPMINGSASTFYVVNKNMKNPEAAIKLYNYFYAKDPALSPDFDPIYHGKNGEQETKPDQNFSLATMTSFYPQQNLFIHQNVNKYFNDKDQSVKENYWVKDNVEQIEQYKAGDNKLWSAFAWSGPENSAFNVIDFYEKGSLFLQNGYIKADTESATQKGATLSQMRAETFTKIIMGKAPVDEFDAYVTKWKKLGGDDITKEVNAAK
ncbi:extracellular solute-binding protein [Paenibacillus sacheonensis]|uniref:Extracellular solute-binding protein n=1 Tax=Paenibacillus sacheonensis TaxID=742054 RepID=A0A7X4YVM5_9BACL|nr:extracellular solute-binding protein [Paenibacillus sacheonensis]MBM7569470.1 putative aldouronate transport system substrate-binding protein [Paenibacillus sacheonensis]NBC73362.1 extracellular solute-binding protein [Paenibacillus sacheonensis]